VNTAMVTNGREFSFRHSLSTCSYQERLLRGRVEYHVPNVEAEDSASRVLWLASLLASWHDHIDAADAD
jgi:hypothetical protein